MGDEIISVEITRTVSKGKPFFSRQSIVPPMEEALLDWVPGPIRINPFFGMLNWNNIGLNVKRSGPVTNWAPALVSLLLVKVPEDLICGRAVSMTLLGSSSSRVQLTASR